MGSTSNAVGSVTDRLGEYVAQTSYRALPSFVVERAKQVVLDVCGVSLLGRSMPAGRMIARYVASLGGNPESTVLGSNRKLPAPLAALANATAAHADELDDVHAVGSHPGACIVPAALAVAERARIAGEELINAVVLGYDVGTRLITALGGMRALMVDRHVSPDIVSSFSAAASVGRLLAVSPDVMRHVWAYAAAQASAPVAFLAERQHLSKAFSDGQAAYAGVTAALLAQLGMEGNEAIFDVPDGVFALWSDGHARDRDALTAGLGHEFAITKTNFKFFSAGYPIHAAIEAAFYIIKQNQIRIEDITEIEVRMPAVNAYIVNNRTMPSISLQDMLPIALRFGRLGHAEAHDSTNLDDPLVQHLRSVIKLVGDDSVGAAEGAARAAAVSIRSLKGQASHEVLHPQGNHRTTVRWEQIEEKFLNLTEAELSKSKAQEVIATVHSLENLPDVSHFASLMLGRDSH